jgi:isopentenyldiphosphate isomerase
MADEIIDICDENNILTGIKKLKTQAHKIGLWHRSAHIWIYNSKKEILLQLRAKEKPLYPNMWDISVAGHVSAGEQPIQAALREIKEEIGLSVKESDLSFFKIIKHKSIFRDIKNNEFYYVYFLKFDEDINHLKLQKEEVQKIKFVSLTELKKELINPSNNLVPHKKYWTQIIKELGLITIDSKTIINYKLSPKNSEKLGFKYIRNIIFDPEAPEIANREIIKMVKSGRYQLGQGLTDAPELFCGLYKKIDDKH